MGEGVKVALGVLGVTVGVGEGVCVEVGVGEGVKVGVAVGVRVGVAEAVAVGVGVRNISPRRLGILQANRRIANQARKVARDLRRLLRSVLHVFTIPYYTGKGGWTNRFACTSNPHGNLLFSQEGARPFFTRDVYLITDHPIARQSWI